MNSDELRWSWLLINNDELIDDELIGGGGDCVMDACYQSREEKHDNEGIKERKQADKKPWSQ